MTSGCYRIRSAGWSPRYRHPNSLQALSTASKIESQRDAEANRRLAVLIVPRKCAADGFGERGGFEETGSGSDSLNNSILLLKYSEHGNRPVTPLNYLSRGRGGDAVRFRQLQ